MPLLDHFHPPLRGTRRWEGFHSGWANTIALQLNRDILPPDYFAEPQVHLGPQVEIDVATFEGRRNGASQVAATATAVWAPPKPGLVAPVDLAHLDTYEVRLYLDEGGPQLRAAIELVSPSNKDR